MTTALATTDRRTDIAAFEPGSIEEALNVSKLLVASRLLPRSITTPEAAFAVIVTGRELGLSAMQSLRAVHIVEGKPTLSADLMVALVKRSDACQFFRLVESSALVATYETHRRGEPGATRLSFSIEEAKAAGVATKDNWRKYPAAMLRARAAAALARAVYPDLVLGVYDPDELASPIVDVTPAPVAAAPVRVEPTPAAPAPVEPPPVVRRRAKAEAAPAPVEPVTEAEVIADEPQAAAVSTADSLVASIAAVGDLAAARNLLTMADLASLSTPDLGRAFAAVLARCTTAAECNDVAASTVVVWKKAGAISTETVEQLRHAYLDRKADISEGKI